MAEYVDGVKRERRFGVTLHFEVPVCERQEDAFSGRGGIEHHVTSSCHHIVSLGGPPGPNSEQLGMQVAHLGPLACAQPCFQIRILANPMLRNNSDALQYNTY